MSQAKVDKRKYEKKNRKKLEKQRKMRLAAKCVATALIAGIVIGVPLGIKIYKEQPKFVGDSVLEAFVGNYIDENYATEIAGLGSKADTSEDNTSEASSEDTVKEALENASGGKLEEVDAEDLDKMLETDSEEEESSETAKEE